MAEKKIVIEGPVASRLIELLQERHDLIEGPQVAGYSRRANGIDRDVMFLFLNEMFNQGAVK